jgi:hypothetical protein
LDSVNSCLDTIGKQLSWEVRNYQQYWSGQGVPIEEAQQLIDIGWALSPQKMKDWCLFYMVPDSFYLGRNNEFFEITSKKDLVALGISDDFFAILASQSSQKITIMLYHECWEDNNFYGPINRLKEIVNQSVVCHVS